MFVYKYESPIDLKAQEKWDDLREFMQCIYEEEQVKDRLEEIMTDNKDAAQVEEVTMK